MAISLGGGGSASQINEVVILNNSANVVTLADGRVYLKAGVIETTQSTYPDATYGFLPSERIYLNNSSSPQGVAWDGTNYYVTDGSFDNVNVFNSSGTYQSNWAVGSQDTQPKGIVWDGSYLWVVGSSTDAVYKYNTSGTYQNVSFSISSQETSPTGITWDGTHFWVMGNSDTVYKYNSSGVYQNVSFSVASQDTSPGGITWDGTSFWMVGNNTDAAYKYNSSGVYQNVSFSVSAVTNEPTGLVWNSTSSELVVLSNQNDSFEKFKEGVGIPALTDSVASYGAELSGTVYTRVK